MSGSTFGKAFRVMTFGESHGPYMGVVIDGVRPGLPVDTSRIQQELDRRRPGQSDIVTPRQETDRVEIISGIFEGKTTGTPICLLIRNRDQRSGDYHNLENILRPGHAAYTFLEKYGLFDYRGGGRASGRETASRVAAGAIAKQFLKSRGIDIIAYTRRIGNIEIESVDFSAIEKNPVRAPDLRAAEKMEQLIHDTREQGDSLGGVIEIVVKNCPAGLGEPVFHKIDAELAGALMSIGAVKAFEAGSGFKAAEMKGSEHNDAYYFDESQKRFRTHTNHSGGVLGGISSGEDLVMRIAVKPPSSIGKPQKTVDRSGNPVDFRIEGRHDPCICPRIVPVAEAMVALVLIDLILLQERISGGNKLEQIRSKIDTIDQQLLLLLARRHRLIGKVSGIKKEQKLGIEDTRRENDLVQNWSEMAKALGLPKKYAGQILETILRFSKQHQKDSAE